MLNKLTVSNTPSANDIKASWNTLRTLKQRWRSENTHLKDLFANNPKRFDQFHINNGGLLYDFSKQPIDQDIINALVNLASASGFGQKRAAMLKGETLNTTENRAALHMALRSPVDPTLEIEGENIANFTKQLHAQISAISTAIRETPDITDVLHIGVGGSNLGPQLVCEALSYLHNGPRIHFISNIDGETVTSLCDKLNADNTAVLIASKSFTTLETSYAADHIHQWLSANLRNPAKIQNHLFAMTARPQKAQDFGIAKDHILPMRDWVGGRFSLWSSIGLPIAIALGFDAFSQLLDGAAKADDHFINAPLHQNIPALMGLIGIWNRNIEGHNGYALLAYADALRTLPQYMQQLDMESNGKASPAHKTAPIVLGGVGTGAQHAFMQSIHQSAEIVPCDFLIIANNPRAPKHFQDALNANALAQSEALMQGRPCLDQAHRHFEGNRPNATLVLPELTPHYLGMLLAMFEHKITTQGFIWDINSFDQFGVELGKTLANEIIEDLSSTDKHRPPASRDSSTQGLINAVKSHNRTRALSTIEIPNKK